MKKIIILACFLSVGLLFIFQIKHTEIAENFTPEQDIMKEKVNQILSSMTLEEKIGQMLILYETHPKVDEEVKELFNQINPGGIILNQENITTYENTKKYIEEIKKLSDIPLIISVDQEGGRVQRLQLLKDISPTYIPDMKSIGKTNNSYLAYETGKI